MIRKKKKIKKGKKKSLFLFGGKKNIPTMGKSSIMIILVSFFVSMFIIGSSYTFQLRVDNYVRKSIVEASGFTTENMIMRTVSKDNRENIVSEIIIGEGVLIPDSCQVEKQYIYCFI